MNASTRPQTLISHEEQDLFCLGCSHKTAPIELREKVFVNELDLSERLVLIKKNFALPEVFALSTCNRFEIYGRMPKNSFSTHQHLELFMQVSGLSQLNQSLKEQLQGSLYFLTGPEAIRHTLSVASSVDSLVVGETQITSQFKKAVEKARHQGTLGAVTDRLAQVALATAKQVRSKTDISKHPVSISHAAIDLAEKVLETLSAKKILVIGAGEMAEICCRYLEKQNPGDLWIANRTLSTAEALVAKLGFGKAIPLQEIAAYLRQADVLISSTAAPHPILQTDDFLPIWKSRRGQSLVMIDIALPRDIESRIGDLEDVYLFDIDDLKAVVDENSSKREHARQEALVIIKQKVDDLSLWLEERPQKHAIASLQQNVQEFFQAELERNRKRGHLKNLDEKSFDLVSESFQLIVQKFADQVLRSMRNETDPHQRRELLQRFEQVFMETKEKNDET